MSITAGSDNPEIAVADGYLTHRTEGGQPFTLPQVRSARAGTKQAR